MAFLYNELAGAQTLKLKNEALSHIKVLRLKLGDSLILRNLQDDNAYSYQIVSFERNEAILELKSFETKKNAPKKVVNLIWCAVEPKTLEKTLPALNELGVSVLTIVYCARSQGSFKYDEERIRRIIISSCEQCGRSEPLKVTLASNIPNDPFYLIDFCGQEAPSGLPEGNYLIGPEGGFSEEERNGFLKTALSAYRFTGSFVLRSETAVIAIASKAL